MGMKDTKISIMVLLGAGVKVGAKNITGDDELYSCFISKLRIETWVNFILSFHIFEGFTFLKNKVN